MPFFNGVYLQNYDLEYMKVLEDAVNKTWKYLEFLESQNQQDRLIYNGNQVMLTCLVQQHQLGFQAVSSETFGQIVFWTNLQIGVARGCCGVQI